MGISVKVAALDKQFKFGHWHSLLVSILSLLHRFLDDTGDFLCGLCQNFIHILCHGVSLAEVLGGGLGSLCIRVKRSLILLQELLFDCNVMVGDAKNNKSIFWFLLLTWHPCGTCLRTINILLFSSWYFRDKLILNKNKCFH